VVPGVAGSIPVRHPAVWASEDEVRYCEESRCRSVAQLVEHRSPKPGVAGSIPAGPVIGGAGDNCWATALSSRGLGHGPLKAGTRVRIPLALWASSGWLVMRVCVAGGVGSLGLEARSSSG
jgi:hypothetical protein